MKSNNEQNIKVINPIKIVLFFINKNFLSTIIKKNINIISDLIKLDLSPDIKIENGINIKNKLEYAFFIKNNSLFLIIKKADTIKPNPKTKPPTINSFPKNEAILSVEELLIPIILLPVILSKKISIKTTVKIIVQK